MAATVVSVVIFLCGVLVGRGVRAERGHRRRRRRLSSAEPTPQQAGIARRRRRQRRIGSDRRSAALEPPTISATSIASRSSKPADEQVEARTSRLRRPPSAENAAAARGAAAARPAARHATEPRSRCRDGASRREPASRCRLRRSTSAARPTRLRSGWPSKGYAAYVLSPANGTPSVYRVRVGKFRRAAKPRRSRRSCKKKSSSSPGLRASARVGRASRAQLSAIRPSRLRLDCTRAAAASRLPTRAHHCAARSCSA